MTRDQHVRRLLGWPAPTTTTSLSAPSGDSVRRSDTAPNIVRISDKFAQFAQKLSPTSFLHFVIAIAALVACEAPTTRTVLWHGYNGTEEQALTAAVARWNTDHPERQIELVASPYGPLGDKLTSAIPGGNGPDLFIYSQDRIGDWADGGVIEPIEFWVDDTRADRFTPASVQAMAYKGSLWGLPMSVKSLAMFYRTDLVAEPPRTTQALLDLAPAMRARDGYAVAYPNGNLYGHAPWLFGHGGTVVDADGELAIATPAAAEAMALARTLVTTGAAPEGAKGPLVASLFNSGKAATAISGPWFIPDIKAGVPWKVAPLPTVSSTGRPAMPFLDMQGILMSSRAKDKDAAFAVMDALTSDVVAIERARIARQLVPNVAATTDPELARDPVLVAFRDQLANTMPMPNGPVMRMVWTPYETALGEVLAGRIDPSQALLVIEREVARNLEH